MSIIIKQILNLIRLLHSENGPNQIAVGLTFGVFLGFSPFLSLQTLLILFILLIFRVQFGMATLAAFFFKFIAYLIDPLADRLGRWALELPSLRDLWTQLYNMPLVPYTRFNNSIVMGSFIFALIVAPIAFFLFKFLVIKYRVHIGQALENTKLWKGFKATKLYDYYSKYTDLYGE